ncbi:polyamine aminopropyltransferase [Phosphitispora sp. TUW77]|uniref:polyamine aminopropyltransferase n=1 Tax=Phosphitispora sp. TUW77 TaxID=3152361 RepID=UPI003AB10BFB
MELWYTEKQTENLGLTCKTNNTLHVEQTEFQSMAVINTVQFGRMLVLDGMVQTTIEDEFVYHEMITHVPLNTHPNPQNVLVIGGGDGGAIREVIKHPAVKKATLVEIDRRVVEISREYFPEISCGLDDPRVTVIYDDGIKHVADHKDYYDVIIVDSTEPVGPAVELFSYNFYKSISESLKKDGLFVAQTESPFFNANIISECYQKISEVFSITKLYLANVPTYPSGLWSFTMGSKKYDPEAVDVSAVPDYPTRYYTPKLHLSCFVLPKFVAELIVP